MFESNVEISRAFPATKNSVVALFTSAKITPIFCRRRMFLQQCKFLQRKADSYRTTCHTRQVA